MGKRYTVMPHITPGGFLVYTIVDTATGKKVGEQECQPWAERKAQELNEREDKGDKR